MAQIQKKFIAANAVDQSKIRLANNSNLRARNAADSADVNILKLNASDKIEFASVPQVSSDPSAANDLVRKSYVDAALEGLKPKAAVRVATTANITIATALNSGDVIDGVTLANGDRVLVKDQSAQEENGIYIVSATPTRSSDFDSLTPIDEINGAYVPVQLGTVNANKFFVETSVVAVLDTDPITFGFFNSAVSYTGGDGIDISTNIISVDHDGEGLTFSGVQLALELDGATLSKSSSGLKVANLGIDTAQLASNAVTTAKIADSNVTADKLASDSVTTVKILNSNVTTAKIANDAVDKDKIAADVAGAGLGQNVDGSLEVKVDDSTIEINSDTLRVKDAGITNAKVATGIDAAKLGDGSVSNTEFQYINSLTSNAQTQISARLQNVDSEQLTLDGTDITNQYKDLGFAAYSASSISLSVLGGPMQQRTVDYSVSLTGGAGGVTRITFLNDLASGGAAELIAGDILIVGYARL